MKKNAQTNKSVYVVDGARTPFLKARSQPNAFSASDLAVKAGQALLLRQPILPTQVDEVILGCTMPSPDEANIARVVALRLGCGLQTPAWTVQRNCASGMQALDNAVNDIMLGRCEMVLAGGTEAMSHAPLLFNTEMVKWLGRLSTNKTTIDKIKTLLRFRPQMLKPVIALMHGLTDPIVNLNMGQTAENIAHAFDISRLQMDTYAVESHQRLGRAHDNGELSEIIPIYDQKGQLYDVDDGLRRDCSIEKLAQLKPFFDKPFGMVTAGNSSQITDGACLLLLASEKAVEKHQLKPLGKIIDTQWAALDPAYMGLGPIHAMSPLLKRRLLEVSDIDYWEINEAFAAQVLGCLTAWEDPSYCKEKLGLNEPLDGIDRERLNVDGGAVALGHPVGASGARIVLHMLHVLKRKQATYGMTSLCIGGGQGGAMLVENVT